MGFALIWSEGLAVALLSLALATAWAVHGRRARGLWVVAVYVVFFGAAAVVVLSTYGIHSRAYYVVRTTWFYYSLAWLVVFTTLSAWLFRRGLKRPAPGLARPAATWPRANLRFAFAGAVVAFGFTFWNMDLAARAELAIARQEAGAVLLAMTLPPVAESQNAARVYAEAVKALGEPIEQMWDDAAHRGIDAKEAADWKDPHVLESVKRNEVALALLRKAAAMPDCNFNRQPSLLDAVAKPDSEALKLRQGATLLAIDARVKAARGNLKGAFEDIAAIFGMVRHLSGQIRYYWHLEAMAWLTLEDALRLAPGGKEPLPPLEIPQLPSLVRQVREEQALLGMVLPAAASQPSLVIDEVRQNGNAVAALLMEAVGVPVVRVFIIPDELAAMRQSFDDYQKSPRSPQEETPQDWANLRKSVETDQASIFGAIYTKPKHEHLLADRSEQAALRQLGRAGLAAVAYQRKHGPYPDRLEQLVPEFLPEIPLDPRDGQPLRIKRFAEVVVLYAPQNSAAVENEAARQRREGWYGAPLFRLPPLTSADNKQGAQEKPTKGGEELLALNKEFDAAQREFFEERNVLNQKLQAVKSVGERAEIEKKIADWQKRLLTERPMIRLAPRFFKFAENNSEGSAGIEALEIVFHDPLLFSGPDGGGPVLDKAIAVLSQGYVGNPEVKRLVPVVASMGGEAGEKFVRAVMQKNPDRLTRARAAQALSEACLRSVAAAHNLSIDQKLRDKMELKIGKDSVGKLISRGNKAIQDRDQLAELIKENYADLIPCVGCKAPEVICQDIAGKQVRLSNLTGKVVVIDIWATWCVPCRQMIPGMREMVAKLKDKPFTLVSISMDSDRETLKKFLEKEPMPWTHWWNGKDGGIVADWVVTHVPAIYILDAQGIIRHADLSEESISKRLEAAVNGLLKEMELK
jgi:thiol-disulfide isomerase/thioredoxin